MWEERWTGNEWNDDMLRAGCDRPRVVPHYWPSGREYWLWEISLTMGPPPLPLKTLALCGPPSPLKDSQKHQLVFQKCSRQWILREFIYIIIYLFIISTHLYTCIQHWRCASAWQCAVFAPFDSIMPELLEWFGHHWQRKIGLNIDWICTVHSDLVEITKWNNRDSVAKLKLIINGVSDRQTQQSLAF